MEALTQSEQTEERIGLRAVVLGGLLSLLFSGINGYLSINMGWNFGYGAIAVMIGYSLFHRMQGGSTRKELSFLMISSVSQMGIYNTLGFILYMLETEPRASYPSWIAPARDVILAKDLSLHHWIGPIGFLAFALFVSLVGGVIYYTVLKDKLVDNPKMVWPSQSANCTLVDACMEGGNSARLVAYAAVVGFVITLVQHLFTLWGFDLTKLDLSMYLPEGGILVISLSLGFAAIGYLITPKTTLSLLGTGLITYLFITPELTRRGLLAPTGDSMALYNEFMLNYAIGPAIGILLLGGILLSVVMLAKKRLTNKEDDPTEETLGYVELYRLFVSGILGNRTYTVLVLGIFTLMASIAYVLNPFAPLPPTFAVLFTAYCFFVAGFLEAIFITKMQGETGMGMGIGSILFYDLPIFAAGYRAFAGYWMYPYLRPNPWVGGGTLPYYKYREETQVSWKEIMIAKIVGWVPTFFFSVFLTFVFWKYVGFGTEMMPAAGLIQAKTYITMLATGDFSTVLNPTTFLAGGVLGALVEVFTPLSMMGIGMALLFPPHYIIPFGVGGIVRVYTQRKYGEDFYKEKGRLIVTGLMTSSLIVQVIMTILQNFV